MVRLRRSGTGRKKIVIRRLETKEARQVCFSKRRPGLFNKANELALLCGVEVAAVAFSPGDNAFSYGHPSVDSVFDRFHPPNPPAAQAAAAVGGGTVDRNQELAALNRVNGELLARLDVEKAQKEAVAQVFATRAQVSQAAAWLDTHVIQMGKEDLAALEAAMGKLDAAVTKHAGKELRGALLAHFTLHGWGGRGFELGCTSREVETIHQLQTLATPPPSSESPQ